MTEPTFQIEEIGPDEATALLEMNVHNRKLVDRAVNQYASAMMNGAWKFDGAPIRLSEEGIILDGQHRLNAVIKSGTSHKFLVVYGVKREAQAVMDTGRKRTLANALTLNGEKDATQLGAMLVLAYRWNHGVRGYQLFTPADTTLATTAILTPQIPTMLEYLEKNPDLRDSVKVGGALSRQVPLIPRVGSLLHYVTNKIDPEDSADFLAKLSSGSGLAADSPILVLRNRLFELGRDRKTRGLNINADTLMAYCLKSWNGYRDGAAMKRMLYKQGGANPDKFPEPK